MSLIGPLEHGYIKIRHFPSREKEAYATLTQARLNLISCIPHEIRAKMMVLDPAHGPVYVPAQPLEAALQKIGMNTLIEYGRHAINKSEDYQYFKEALDLFRAHIRQNNTFIRASVDIAVDHEGDARPGAPVQLNFIMLERTEKKLLHIGNTVHIKLDGMFKE
jgi:hypothetical protein